MFNYLNPNTTFSLIPDSKNKNNLLTELGIKNRTDKALFGYLNIYEKYFHKLKDKNITILEIGVLQSCSLNTWREYFPNAYIIGADILDVGTNIRGEKVSNHFFNYDNNSKFYLCDQSKETQLEEMCKNILETTGKKIDIVIDDGSHFQYDMMLSLGVIFPYMNKDGLYILEDICTESNLLRGDSWWGETYKDNHKIEDCVELTLLKFKETNNIESIYLSEKMTDYINKNTKNIDYYKAQVPPITQYGTSSLAILSHN